LQKNASYAFKGLMRISH